LAKDRPSARTGRPKDYIVPRVLALILGLFGEGPSPRFCRCCGKKVKKGGERERRTQARREFVWESNVASKLERRDDGLPLLLCLLPCFLCLVAMWMRAVERRREAATRGMLTKKLNDDEDDDGDVVVHLVEDDFCCFVSWWCIVVEGGGSGGVSIELVSEEEGQY
jgi:hypothetical protein